MKVIFLAAGYGTRLYPLTLEISKPLIPVNDKPIINFLVDKIKKLGRQFPIEEVVVVCNNKFYGDFLSWRRKYKVKAKILNDGSNTPEDRLGAIRDLAFAAGKKRGDLLVIGADNLFDDELTGFVKSALNNRPFSTVGIYDLNNKQKASRYGTVKINSRKEIVEFQEKVLNPSSTLVSSCVYFFPKESVPRLGQFLAESGVSDASGKYIAWLAARQKVFAYKLKGKWIDIGHHDSLLEAEKEFKTPESRGLAPARPPAGRHQAQSGNPPRFSRLGGKK